MRRLEQASCPCHITPLQMAMQMMQLEAIRAASWVDGLKLSGVWEPQCAMGAPKHVIILSVRLRAAPEAWHCGCAGK